MIRKLRLTLVVILVGITGEIGYSQQTCSMSVASAPAVRGFRLRMTSDEVEELLTPKEGGLARNLTKRRDQFGVSSVGFTPWKELGVDFSGVYRVELEFFDDRLSKFTFKYVNEGHLSINEFVAKISEATGLPKEWPASRRGKIEVLAELQRQIECDGFRVEAEVLTLGMTLMFEDTVATRLLAERKAAKEKRDRETFRP